MTEEFHDKARRLLDEHARDLDAATLSRLHQARNQALRQHRPFGISWLTGRYFAGSAIAACLALVTVYFYQVQPPPLPSIFEDPIQQETAENIELLDDLEFMAWLVIEEDVPIAAATSS